MSTLDRAIQIAAVAHAGQTQNDEPYILHPLRVMMMLGTKEEQIVGVLHDVVEKTPAWTLDRLRQEGFSAEILTAIEALTRKPDEDYFAYILRARENRLSRIVKSADLTDHVHQQLAAEHSRKEAHKLQRYQSALRQLDMSL